MAHLTELIDERVSEGFIQLEGVISKHILSKLYTNIYSRV